MNFSFIYTLRRKPIGKFFRGFYGSKTYSQLYRHAAACLEVVCRVMPQARELNGSKIFIIPVQTRRGVSRSCVPGYATSPRIKRIENFHHGYRHAATCLEVVCRVIPQARELYGSKIFIIPVQTRRGVSLPRPHKIPIRE